MLDSLATALGPAFYQYLLIGLVTGLLYALIALGYTMVYGIIELINFAHGDLFMLGSFLALQVAIWVGAATATGEATGAAALPTILLMLVAAPVFCAGLNVTVDRVVYKPLRNAPKLAPLVSAIGVSFIFMNIGVFWMGTYDLNFPKLVPQDNLTPGARIALNYKHIMVLAVTLPVMVALTVFVRYTSLGKAMRATAQNPTAAQLMGINVDRVIAATFAIGGGLGGVAAVVYGLYNNTVGYMMGFQTGLYAFTAAVLGGIGNIPGAVLGGIIIGLVRSLGSAYVGEQWSEALIFAILIVILIFRPNGILGARTREKV
ncbi:High-affinity branched-chain amino acid transport system permease protein LivH [Gemmata obscuriglobus]|uniref:Branched-chain amino acid ABC transporter permease n=1 Tax=Gemmata obscuriglobus TaxID=114 RepID=A0A2Z3GT71_9BACT|nr:branched-chain amino acid ABC transporter permease [Gemmata obscuriglobus]AWM35711.1 branched-chain amino acid ABC transporter permease [Gemmata obscuriglobus]QEG31759.1 High-affinity branched-chain amino acid transport system permease protein LivH [Gemmata obscuriglobus]VTS11105.1 abc transporter permease : Inner-membrane translocator OS=Pirellula staleyi (strain ATCC 27377 / DSM 6068 / ICPB 4128) GN=Psta_4548 PE=4 SV=1: BPD_transp_2 [Gemmata obscuriglobus UQM 2246]